MNKPPSFRLRLAIILLLSAPLFTSGCRGEGPEGDPSLVLEVGISPTPPAVGTARLIITLQDTAGVAISGAEILVEGNMSHAGMVPVLDTAQMEGPGLYIVPGFNFTMAGDWILTLDATLADGRTVRIRKATNVVGAFPGPSGVAPE